MGTKISALTTTGSAPTGSYIPLAFEGENYKVLPEGIAVGSSLPNLDAEFTATSSTMIGGEAWFCFDDASSNITATIHTDTANALAVGDGDASDYTRAAKYTIPADGFYQVNAMVQMNLSVATSISMKLHKGSLPDADPLILAVGGQVAGENQETICFAIGKQYSAGDTLAISYICAATNVATLQGHWSIHR